MSHANDASSLLKNLGLNVSPTDLASQAASAIDVHSPIDGSRLARISATSPAAADASLHRAHQRFLSWRDVPAPKRGELVRAFGESVRRHKPELGRLITLETGKVLQEGLGEVQEVIDICDVCGRPVALALRSDDCQRAGRAQVAGNLAPGGRGRHHFRLQVSDGGICLECRTGAGLRQHAGLEAFRENAASAMALNGLLLRTANELELDTEGLSELLIGERPVGEALVNHPQVKLISATAPCHQHGELWLKPATGPRHPL